MKGILVAIEKLRLSAKLIVARVLGRIPVPVAFKFSSATETMFKRFDRRQLTELWSSASVVVNVFMATYVPGDDYLHAAKRLLAFSSSFHDPTEALEEIVFYHADLVKDKNIGVLELNRCR